MPIHDWTRVDAGTYHDFHQDWTMQLRRALNAGVLPPGYRAMADQKVFKRAPDVVALHTAGADAAPEGGIAVADVPPQVRQIVRVETEAEDYARRANRLAIRNRWGQVVAIVEIVSPGNKDRVSSLRSFTRKAAKFLRRGIHFHYVDLFPPTPRDPQGLHQALWDELFGEPFAARPEGKPLTAGSIEAGEDDLVAYVEPLAVGDVLPSIPLFLRPGIYVPCPLEASYVASWEALAPEVQAALNGETPA